jgi:hypothetical protein
MSGMIFCIEIWESAPLSPNSKNLLLNFIKISLKLTTLFYITYPFTTPPTVDLLKDPGASYSALIWTYHLPKSVVGTPFIFNFSKQHSLGSVLGRVSLGSAPFPPFGFF